MQEGALQVYRSKPGWEGCRGREGLQELVRVVEGGGIRGVTVVEDGGVRGDSVVESRGIRQSMFR